jgi:hypothetical protein
MLFFNGFSQRKSAPNHPSDAAVHHPEAFSLFNQLVDVFKLPVHSERNGFHQGAMHGTALPLSDARHGCRKPDKRHHP